ncbi:MAG: peptide-N4-asparagine amidase [Gammaproteobacteria bacterium]
MSRVHQYLLSLALLLASASVALAAPLPLNPPPPPTTGSSNIASADINVSHPNTTPCVVTLFQGQSFDNFTPKPISYAPPGNCAPPWGRVVFVGNFSVTPGIQFDRTAYLFLGDTNIFYGTTPEPSPNLGPSWNVQRDVTDLSSLFKNAQNGSISIGNVVNSTYTGVIQGSGYLYFYPPAGGTSSAPQTPNDVIPLNSGNGPATLQSTSSLLSKTITFPMNMTNLYLDVIAQSQSNDEFWYTCVSNDVAGELQSCGGTGFRQVEIFIDGTLAGLAPVSPWIYTGGIDPYLWFPTTGAQTLNFKPYRVNLTPFVGKLDDGAPHTVSVAVYNANGYFLASAKLLAFQDTSVQQITGAVTESSVPAPAPVTANDLTTQGGNISGTVDISSNPGYTVSGYIMTPAGKVTTTVKQDFNFANNQTFNSTQTMFQQDIAVTNNVTTTTTVGNANGTTNTQTEQWMFPLSLNITQTLNPDGTLDQTTTSQQTAEQLASADSIFDTAPFGSHNIVKSTDTLIFNSSGALTGKSNTSSSQQFEYETPDGKGGNLCYNRTIKNTDNAVASVTDSNKCDNFPPPPSITQPPSVTIPGASSPGGTHAGPLYFTVGGSDPLKLSASSSNPTLLPASNIKFGSNNGEPGERSVTLFPVAQQSGSATITLTVSDPYDQTAKTSFNVTVQAVEPPQPTHPGSSGGGGALGFAGLALLAALALLAGLSRRFGSLRNERNG